MKETIQSMEDVLTMLDMLESGFWHFGFNHGSI